MSRPAQQHVVRPSSRAVEPARGPLRRATRAVGCACAVSVLLGMCALPAQAAQAAQVAGSGHAGQRTGPGAWATVPGAEAGTLAADLVHATPAGQHSPAPRTDQRRQRDGVAGEAGLTLALGAVLFAAAAGRRRGS
ncbi:hypothetical protein [Streptomyces oceani]|uniref:Gram-positive cocci surface proteins LPxTG domain-containing protein n=1 Tax=Streptomyces oceani TaxID=1075402 RepID=A0A1E7KFZ2_9ACTN|nr:hypothetical protein [Streptomyces oceani]OEV02841.1 hypothetical protein AN216_15640 [Streptomyces oceani]